MIESSMTSTANLIKKLEELSTAQVSITEKELMDKTLKIHEIAVKSIQEHQSSGITYKRKNREHTASAPGNPPNSDTGNLAKNIGFNVDFERLEGVVGTNVEYGKYLEFGTKKMAARPWLLPAFAAVVPEFVKELREKLLELYKSKRLR